MSERDRHISSAYVKRYDEFVWPIPWFGVKDGHYEGRERWEREEAEVKED